MEITKRLASTPTGKRIKWGELFLRVSLTSNGCKKCAFEKEEGARFCGYASGCMAYLRPDHKPVKFVVVE